MWSSVVARQAHPEPRAPGGEQSPGIVDHAHPSHEVEDMWSSVKVWLFCHHSILNVCNDFLNKTLQTIVVNLFFCRVLVVKSGQMDDGI